MIGMTVTIPMGLRASDPPQEDAFITLTRTVLDSDKLPTNVTTLDHETIQKLSIQNAGDAIEYLAGIDVQKNSGLGSSRLPKIRGFLNKQVAIYIDNRRVPPDVTGNVDLSIISAEQIERIEVLRGGASVLYGPNAEGGIIHIITKRFKSSLPRASAGLTLKSFGTHILQAEASHKMDRLEAYITASRRHSDGFLHNSYFDNQSFGGNFAFDFGVPGKTSIDFTVNRNENGNPGGTPYRPDQFDGVQERTANNMVANQKDNLDSVSLEHVANLTEIGSHGPLTMTTRLSGTETTRKAQTSATSISTHVINTRTAYVQFDFPFGFTMGYEYERTMLRSPFSQVGETNGWGVFFQENFNWKNLTVIPGVRYDQNTEWGNTTNPRISVIYQATPQFKLSANAGSAFQAPTFADFTDYDPVTGNSQPRTEPGPFPEKSIHYDFGMEMQPSETLNLKATLFRADIKDRLVFQSSGFGGTTKNLQDSFNQGVEVEITHSLGDILYQNLNYTYLDSEGKGTGIAPDFVALRFSPLHRLNYTLEKKITPLDATLGSVVQYVSEQWTSNIRSGLKLPDYVVWNLYGAKKFGMFEFRVGSDNVLDRRYAQNATEGFAGFTPDLYFPQPGRTYWGSVVVKFN